MSRSFLRFILQAFEAIFESVLWTQRVTSFGHGPNRRRRYITQRPQIPSRYKHIVQWYSTTDLTRIKAKRRVASPRRIVLESDLTGIGFSTTKYELSSECRHNGKSWGHLCGLCLLSSVLDIYALLSSKRQLISTKNPLNRDLLFVIFTTDIFM